MGCHGDSLVGDRERRATMRTGLLFPGQGSQHVGMGRGLAESFEEARDTFAEADEILGFPLSQIAWEGPDEELTATENAQPALYVHSIAAFRVARSLLGTLVGAAGHSLGELTAHAAAGSYTFADGLRAVRLRGELMASASEISAGTMAAVLGLEAEVVRDLCRKAKARGHVVVPANFNAPGQVVLSGDAEGVAWTAREARERGARRVVQLRVAGAFHSPLMRPAVAEFEASLAGVAFERPDFPIVANVTAEAVEEPASVPGLLARQLTSAVRWVECVESLVGMGVERLVELGPGRVLTNLCRRSAKGVTALAVGTPESISLLEGNT